MFQPYYLMCGILSLNLITEHIAIQYFFYEHIAIKLKTGIIAQPKVLFNFFLELLSPTKSSNRVSIPGLFDKECQVSDPWGSLLKLIILLGQLMDWDVPQDLFSEPRCS